MSDPASRALDHVRQLGAQDAASEDWPITLNFHPDIAVAGCLVIDRLAADGIYRSQFETGTSSGGLTAFRGGDRWQWESSIFGGAYDDENPSLRPKYGALNHLGDPFGGSRRFGSAHFRLRSHVRARTSFSYPDSHLEPQNFAVDDVRPLIALANENERSLDPWLDNYIEAHIHGPLVIEEDVEALILDPSFRGTRIDEAAVALGCDVEWHDGFCLTSNQLADCRAYRGNDTATALAEMARGGRVTPTHLWRARQEGLTYQIAKWAWHCIARFGT